jgi:Sec-independent protein translocase protein TatA
MDIFGIGLPEIVFILLLVVIIFGPKDLEKMARTIGSGLSRFFKSDTYRDLRRIGDLPTELVRKAGLDEFRASINSTKGANPQNPPAGQTLPPASPGPEEKEPENRIAPPSSSGDKPG